MYTLSILRESNHFTPVKLPKDYHKEVPDPYVKLRVCGVPFDSSEANKFKTKSICNNGFSPSWDETFEFNVRIPELAFLEVILMDEDVLTKNDLLGYSYIPMEHIRPGYRMVSLYQADGSVIPSASLLFHVCIL